ncbi:hypothetical protein QFC22_002637 [Naganishia vaughanmartiniae]|uniref:Uncharacterized protein n=1 Tax=Naganishia vaughanmartiniae TaxID=1424756 RepID=A0ACC2XBK5_9TREE|nr:hypothetical protein QFC22_002637 [Naganishia vaughanmartiniae]
MLLTPTSAYEILKSIVAPDTILTLYDLKGVQKEMFVNLLSLKTVFGLEHSSLKLRKDEEGFYRIHIYVRCAPAFIVGLNLAYTRLSHQGDPSLIRRDDQKANLQLAASLSLPGVKTILHFAKIYGIRGVHEELERLICNDTFLRLRGDQWTGRDIQKYLVDSKPVPKSTTDGKGFQSFIPGLSAYEEGIYLVHHEVVIRRRDLKAAQLAVYYASLDKPIDKDVHHEAVPV